MSYMSGEWFRNEAGLYHPQYYRNEDEDMCRCENRINVNGKGTVKVIPDIAVVILGAVTEGNDLNTIQKENAEIMENVIYALRKLGIDERDIETESYIVEPVYDFVEGKQIFRGYRVRNMLRVTVRETGRIGKIIDTAVKSGANTVSSIDFDIAEQSGYYYQALKLAIEDAVRKAEVLSQTMGVNVDRVPVSVAEESYGPIPMVLGAFTDRKAAATPIMPKKIEITATVKAVFKYDRE